EKKIKAAPLRILFSILFFLSMSLIHGQDIPVVDHPQAETAEKLIFQLYPNPFSGGELYLQTNRPEVKALMIINILGEVVFQTTTLEDKILPPNLPSGIYIVKLRQGVHQGLSRMVVP
ncbi:MAG: T9SS C-terminal target domain-containing protein, partial [Flavobacteriia bacterium]|nr:T9SS C-terminal target domain-containing protein [Flavobacteriia bacterium]